MNASTTPSHHSPTPTPQTRVFPHRVIRYGNGRGTAWNWTVATIADALLLGDYLLLAIANAGFDASLCFHPAHRAMVYARGQAARARRFRSSVVSTAGLAVLGLLELFVDNFTHEYVRTCVHACVRVI